MTAILIIDEVTDEAPCQWWPHEGHDKGHLGVSRTDARIRRYCCDNCGAHHWGMYYTIRGYDFAVEHDFDYMKPDGEPYRCANGHILHGGPEYCMGECDQCRRSRPSTETFVSPNSPLTSEEVQESE